MLVGSGQNGFGQNSYKNFLIKDFEFDKFE